MAVVLVAAGAGVAAGYLAGSGSGDTVTTTETQTVTESSASGVPEPVEETRRALLAAAEAGDYEALRRLLPASGFEYTFGGPVEGGPIAYWQRLDTARPVPEILADILRMPYVLSRGYYVWPWAYTGASASDLSDHERTILAPLGDPAALFVPGTGYLGWRTGIAPDGTWTFFVAGD